MARPKVGLWFGCGLPVVYAGVLSVICAGVLRQGQAVGVLVCYGKVRLLVCYGQTKAQAVV